MKRRGPLLTLAAAAVLGMALLIANISKQEEPNKPAPAAQSQPAVAESAGPTPTTGDAPEAAAPFPAKQDYVDNEIATATGVITLSVTIEGDKAIAYACDGNTIETWLKGSAVDGKLSLANADNTSRLDGRLDGPDLAGTLFIGDKSWPYVAAPVAPPAGIYVNTVDGSRQSWIVAADGTVTGVQRGPGGATSPAPALSPNGTAVVDGETVTAVQVSGGDVDVF